MSLRSLFSALPDVATACLYAICWIAPSWLGYHWIKSLMLVMLMEFLVVHSGAFIGQTVLGDGARSTKIKVIVGFGAFYMIFVLAFCLALREWWPVAAFGWLLLSKFSMVVLEPKPRALERQRQMVSWGISLATYVGVVFLTAIVPVPEFGIDEIARAAAAIPGSGLWVDQPQTVIAAGMLYFAILAAAKLFDVGAHAQLTKSR